MNAEPSIAAEVRLPRPPGVLRRALAAHPLAVDVFIVVWYFIGCGLGVLLDLAGAFGVATAWGQPYYLHGAWWLLALLRALVTAAALLYRRRFPLIGLTAVTVLTLGDPTAQTLPNGVALLFLLYAVPVYRSVSAGWVGYGIALAGAIVGYFVSQGSELSAGVVGPGGTLLAENDANGFGTADFIAVSVMTAMWYLAVVLLGINLGNRRRYLEAVIERAHQLARERDQLAQLAVAEERSRIAREMHDIVAHSVSVMIALSEGAARAVSAAPDAAAEAMERSAETGRTALAEMRRMLGALQESDAAELAPQPGVEDLPELVRGFRDAGLGVALDVSGDASGDRGQDLAVYRVVQEGLTNVLRYAGVGARAEVSVRRAPDRTLVEVRDFGPAAGSHPPESGLGSGRGIAGLRERARFFGGEIWAGPTAAAGGGWVLRAELPVNADARERGGSLAPKGSGNVESEEAR
ncbi:histidine kinase [Leucobacter ruminantium]|uniref:histidine kinase n=1 Tax=Leucobacter ruminantium TaxID=1289170 RepID=A0A939RZ23_9MICO|nr:two-component sensor histidine kinase [Leucobacter ruminantium]